MPEDIGIRVVIRGRFGGPHTLTEAAALLGLSSATLRWQIKNGKLKAHKFGPIWRVSEREIERYRRDNLRSPYDKRP